MVWRTGGPGGTSATATAAPYFFGDGGDARADAFRDVVALRGAFVFRERLTWMSATLGPRRRK
jgi:hypothetical protein